MLTLFAYKFINRRSWIICLALCLDIALGNLWVAFNGGISNPFTSLLLIFIVIAFLLLPTIFALVVVLVSILGQVAQVSLPSLLPGQQNHAAHALSDEMLKHAQGMVIGFIIAALIIAVSLYYLKQQWFQSEKALQDVRERQLRDEQLLTIGAAAAQLTHDVATPVQSLRLLNEELQECDIDLALKRELNEYLTKVEASLEQWREAAEDVRSNRLHNYTVGEIVTQLQQLLRVARPDAQVNWESPESLRYAIISADRTLFPAIVNLIINALSAGERSNHQVISVQFSEAFVRNNRQLQIHIVDNGDGLSQLQQKKIGKSITSSEQGMGVGAVISHATVERLGGQVSWQSTTDGTLTLIVLPVVANA
ncbi:MULTISPECIES: sensor histidine kinase [Idiomarina]|uniref:sensor histidine kinase n=1 Tax=Idiomarina TaxID=135575 RepID=UPI00241EF080|nr:MULTISPECIES: ATP-binding protein [Idiomarina]|tara:strand:- start:558 stop:1655 length:1098 start_codon:yes stop_codon:yes gene_type:complete